jgi:hypothetical protein
LTVTKEKGFITLTRGHARKNLERNRPKKIEGNFSPPGIGTIKLFKRKYGTI